MNECPIAIERKEEFDRQNAQLAKPVNYTSQPSPQKPSTSGPLWSPTPNWPMSYPVLNYTPLPYTQALTGPPPQPMPILPPLQYTQTWSRSSTPQSYEPTNLPPPLKLEPRKIPERASDSPPSSMVNIINAISGGSNEPVHETKRQHKEYFRTVSHVSEGKHFRTQWSHILISFTQADLRLQYYPHNDPLVIRPNVGKNSIHFTRNDVGRIIVDNGSSADFLVWQCFIKMGLTEKSLQKSHYPLIGFGGKRFEALGKIELNVTFDEGSTQRTKAITFDVVDINYPYNAIFGCNTLVKFAAVIH